MKPNFKNLNIHSIPESGLKTEVWEQKNHISADWETPEQIKLKQAYTADDLENMEHLNYAAGIPPFLRGPYSTMFVMQPWTVRQYAGFSTAEDSNAFYRRHRLLRQDQLE